MARALAPLLIAGVALAPEHGEARFCPKAPISISYDIPNPQLNDGWRIASYNIKVMSMSPYEVVRSIRLLEADIVLLQEVTSENIECLENNFPDFHIYFAPATLHGELPYGLAIMSTTPLNISALPIPTIIGEPRIVMVADNSEITVANTHLATNRETRAQQLDQLPRLLGALSINVFGGDFNTASSDTDFILMLEALDLKAQANTTPTFHGGTAIDHFLTNSVERGESEFRVIASKGSDHDPITIEFLAP